MTSDKEKKKQKDIVWKEFQKIDQTAWDKCRKASQTTKKAQIAWEEYKKVRQIARKEYLQKCKEIDKM